MNHFKRSVSDMLFGLLLAVGHRSGQVTRLCGRVAVSPLLYQLATSRIMLEIGSNHMSEIAR